MNRSLFFSIAFACFLALNGCKSAKTSKDSARAVVAAPAEKAVHPFTLQQNVPWVTVEGITLTMDIYTPRTGRSSYPVLVIYHGGGWLINNETIMDEMAKYVVEHGEYVVCNVNYRLLTANNNSTNMNGIVEDVMGAVLWIKDHISRYKGDPKKIAVSGDSAGGHLAAMVALGGDRLESDGYAGPTLGFRPSYLPAGKTAEDIERENRLEVQAVVMNYPAVDIYRAAYGSRGDRSDGFEAEGNIFWNMGGAKARGLFGNEINPKDHPGHYRAVSPIYLVPDASERKLPPHYIAVGSKDNLTTPASVKAYADELKKAGQPAEYWEYEGRPHAYLDSGSNQFLGTSFQNDAPHAIDRIIKFLDSVFYGPQDK